MNILGSLLLYILACYLIGYAVIAGVYVVASLIVAVRKLGYFVLWLGWRAWLVLLSLGG